MGYTFKVNCTNCDYQSVIGDISEEYILKNEGVIDRVRNSKFEFKYCHSCNSIQFVFLGKPMSWKLNKAKVALNEKILEYSKANWFNKILLKNKLDEIKNEVESLKLDYEMSLEFWKKENSIPRCMCCGLTNIELTDIELPRTSAVLISNINHICGGYLTIEKWMHVHSEFGKYVYYDSKGYKLEEGWH